MRALPVVSLALLLAGLPARADFLSTETLAVERLAPLPGDPDDARWGAVPALQVVAAPQRSIQLNDRRANAALADAGNRVVTVRAATDGAELAVLVDWADPTESRPGPDGVDAYGDAVALQFPLRFGAGIRLPYVGMGDSAQPVVLYLARAAHTGSTLRQSTAEGFGSSRRDGAVSARAGMRYDPATRRWRALIVRPVRGGGTDLGRALVPFSVAVWDGAALERGGNKALAGWRFLRMPGAAPERAFETELAWGHGAGDLGDPDKGKELFQGACSACHSVGGDRAPAGLAPELTTIGVVATPSYLRESIVAPSSVIVPNPNPAQHQDRAGKPGPGGAWPLDEAYVWYSVGSDGKRTSSMPDYASMPEDEVRALVAYLSTLGTSPAVGGKKP
jgi:DMSO reductase family type II enzyme heme b subunit